MSLLFMLIVIAGLPLLAAISYRNIKTLEAEEGQLPSDLFGIAEGLHANGVFG